MYANHDVSSRVLFNQSYLSQKVGASEQQLVPVWMCYANVLQPDPESMPWSSCHAEDAATVEIARRHAYFSPV